MNPSVSVVIPAYNHAAFVGEAIQSVLDQSYGDVEIVITDDGSTDRTVEVIRGFTDPRIALEVFEKNRGASVALNSAIRRARGEFICMLASDDCFLPGKLETQVRFLRANSDIGAVFGLPQFVDERGASLATTFNGDVFTRPFGHHLRSRYDWLRYFFFEGNCLCHPSAMVRRSVYDEVGLYDPRFASLPDFDMWVRLCIVYEIHLMPHELTAMRILDHNRNMSAPRRDSNLRTLIENFHVLKHYRRLSREAIRTVFAGEIAAANLDVGGALGPLLAEIALQGQNPPHKLFALDTMFEGTSTSGGDYSRLIDVTGSVDVFAIEAARNEPRLTDQLESARAEAVQLRAELSEIGAKLAAAQEETAHLSSALASERKFATQLNATLTATQAETTHLNDELDTVRAEVTHLREALGAALAGSTKLREALAAARDTSEHVHVELDAARAESARLHAALKETFAKAADKNAALGAAHAEIARLTTALGSIRQHVDEITTGSGVFKLARHFKSLRQSVDRIATEIAGALGNQ